MAITTAQKSCQKADPKNRKKENNLNPLNINQLHSLFKQVSKQSEIVAGSRSKLHLMVSQYGVSLLWIFHHKFKINSQRIQKGTLMCILPWERHITVELILSSRCKPHVFQQIAEEVEFLCIFSLWHRDLSSVYITITLFVLLCVSKLSYLVHTSTPWKHDFLSQMTRFLKRRTVFSFNLTIRK